MKKIQILIICCLVSYITSAQNFQLTPEGVLSEVLKAVEEEDFTNIDMLCHPLVDNDQDVQNICDLDLSLNDEINEFIEYFENLEEIGDTTYSYSLDGFKMAEIPLMFYDLEDDSLSVKTMKFIRIESRWYLFSF